MDSALNFLNIDSSLTPVVLVEFIKLKTRDFKDSFNYGKPLYYKYFINYYF